MDGAARQFAVETTAHHLGDIVERQREPGAHLADQLFLHSRERAVDLLGPGGAVLGGGAAFPAAHRLRADAKLGSELGHPRRGSPEYRRGSWAWWRRWRAGSAAWCEALHEILDASAAPMPSGQHCETEHFRGDDVQGKAKAVSDVRSAHAAEQKPRGSKEQASPRVIPRCLFLRQLDGVYSAIGILFGEVAAGHRRAHWA